jgi:hypothetical protein
MATNTIHMISQTIANTVSTWKGVTIAPHRFGGNQPTLLQADGVWKRICSQTAGLGCSFITSLQAAGNPPLID